MATGYTSVIKDGISVRGFILRCTRAMGACITQKDQGIDVLPAKSVEVSDYHQKQIDKSMEEYVKLREMNNIEQEQAAAREYEKAVMENRTITIERDELQYKYEAMLKSILVWQPPTPDHNGLKEFMIEQLRESLNHDCGEYTMDVTELDSIQWYRQQRDRILGNICYHVIEKDAEEKRTAGRNDWLKALWDSLPEE